jgi:hypothetical protein
MPSFTTRVELHDATWQDYENLHSQMQAQGFARTIGSDDGVVYHLPWAEYDLVGQLTCEQVRDRAVAAAAAAAPSRGRAILVSQALRRCWIGLTTA